MSVEGSVCVVTGAGRGIGAETARLLAAHGAHLAMCSVSGQGLDRLADELHAAYGTRTLVRQVDVADATAVQAFADATAGELGLPHVLVNNAAVLGPVGPVVETDADEWARTLLVNVVGVANACRSFGRLMHRRGAGVVVNLSGGGIGGPNVAPRIAAYTASKAAVVSLTETLAAELGPGGVRLVAIAPGAMATGFTAGVRAAGPEVAGADLYEATVRNDESPAPFDDFARLLLYAVSDEAAWLSGRLLSARWDPPDSLRARRDAIVRSSLLTLRRIDGDLYLDAALEGS
ncbi:MAG TPA: SDR family oxidoreductase [Acidimicrobiales bacterium]|nr:SDR family oxidoreductase [Acidimicrobiales bacterium]